MGRTDLGYAVPFGTGILRALRSRAWQAAQETDGLGVAVALADKALDPRREIVAVADSTYSSLKLLDRCRRLSNPITFITRLRLDAALYEPAPPRYPGQIGRPRLKDERLANLSVIAQAPSSAGKIVTLAEWYGKEERMVEVVSSTAIWHSTGLPAVPLRLCVGPRSAKRVRRPSFAGHRSLSRSRTDHLLVRQALANGSHFPGGGA